MNTTNSSGMSPEIKTFYDKVLLERALPNLPFLKYGQKKPIPKGNGKTIEFRKFNSLEPATTPLTEGQPPVAKDLTVTSITASVKQYGDVVEVSDVLDETAIDPVITETIELEGEQSGETLNTVVRDILLATTSEYNVGGGVDVNAITASDKLKADDILKLKTIFKRGNIKPIIGNKYYLMLLAPEQIADIMRDKLWQDVNTYSASEKIEEGEIGRIYGFKFIDTTLLDAEDNTNGVPVFSGLALGKNAYGITDISNGSKPKSIIKLAKDDDSDRSDPLNQKSTIGWKALFTAIILDNLAVIRVNSSATDVEPDEQGGGDTHATPTTHTVYATAGIGGTVSPASITVAAGSTVSIVSNVITIDNKTITASAETGYVFANWTGVTDGATISQGTAITAIFTAQEGGQ